MRLVAAFVGLCCLLPSCGNSSGKDGSTYPESKAGLKELIGDISKAARKGKTKTAKRLARAMQLADHRSWYIEHFGTVLGEKLTREYNRVAEHLEQMVPALKKFSDAGQTKIIVERFDKPNDPASIVYQHLALKKMKKRTSLYSVRLVKPGEKRGFHLWSFAYAADGFRWIGKLTAVANTPGDSPEHDKNALRLRELKQAMSP